MQRGDVKLLGIAWVCLLITVQSFGQITGKVIAIADGDSFTILTSDHTQLKVRLHGVDCPEKKAPFGAQAKTHTSNLIFGKTIRLKKKGTDQYRRILAIVYTPEGKNLNEELLKAGFAWHYKQHDKNPLWSQLEKRAKFNKRGLWAVPNPVPPWEYRKLNKKSNSKLRVKQLSH